MPLISGWLASEGQPDAIAEIISYKSVSTGTITRGASTASAVTIRLETLSGNRQIQTPNGQVHVIDALALAVFGTDLRPGDRFTVAGRTFEVIALKPGMTDNVHAYLKMRA